MTITAENSVLAASIELPNWRDSKRGVPVVVICHGFVGNRIGVNRIFVKAARSFAEAGHCVVRFDFSGCGESTGEYGSGGLDAMVDETLLVIDSIVERVEFPISSITLIGHSLGGPVAIRAAARDPRVSNLVLWSAVGNPFEEIVQITGISTYEEAVRTGSADYLGYRLGLGFFRSLAKFHPYREVREFSGDVLVLHGSADNDISPGNAVLYEQALAPRSRGDYVVDRIAGGDHTFSGEPAVSALLDKTRTWLRERRQTGRILTTYRAFNSNTIGQ